jgi:hypothetical protein
MKPQFLGYLRYMAPAGLIPNGLAWVNTKKSGDPKT